MGGRNALKEYFGFGRVNVDVDPPRPCGQPFIICNQTVHILVQLIPLLHVIPSVQMQHSPSDLPSGMIEIKKSYGCVLPVWVHQCHVLKISMSMPFHAFPLWIESSFNTRPTFSLTKSTRYVVRYSINFTP